MGSEAVRWPGPGLWLAGYGGWPAALRAGSLVEALRLRGVTRLVDVRLSPCSSDPVPGRPYGPKPWNLQAGPDGLVGLLDGAGIAYEWLVELGNPQRRDHAMAVLRAHLADPLGGWPVHRGLGLLADRVRRPGESVAILCACGDWRACHRTVVGRALADRHFEGRLPLLDLRTGRAIPGPPTIGERSHSTNPEDRPMSIAIREKDSNLVLARGEPGSEVVPYEGNLYFDPAVVDESLLETTGRTYTCPMKGTCHWVDFVDPAGRRVKDVAWVYQETKPGHEAIAGKFGFYAGARGGTKQEG